MTFSNLQWFWISTQCLHFVRNSGCCQCWSRGTIHADMTSWPSSRLRSTIWRIAASSSRCGIATKNPAASDLWSWVWTFEGWFKFYHDVRFLRTVWIDVYYYITPAVWFSAQAVDVFAYVPAEWITDAVQLNCSMRKSSIRCSEDWYSDSVPGFDGVMILLISCTERYHVHF